jgi:hypothetical protein
MASGWTNYFVNKILDLYLRGVAYTAPSPIYLALFTATPSDTGGGTECTGGGYARVSMTPATSLFNASSGGSTSNTSTITVTASATGSFGGSVTQWGIYDAASAGNLLFWADISNPQTIASGNSVSFAAGALVIGAT